MKFVTGQRGATPRHTKPQRAFRKPSALSQRPETWFVTVCHLRQGRVVQRALEPGTLAASEELRRGQVHLLSDHREVVVFAFTNEEQADHQTYRGDDRWVPKPRVDVAVGRDDGRSGQ